MSAIPIAQYAPTRHGILVEAFLRLGAMLAQMRTFVRRMFCGLRGHETVLHFERNRLSLYCLRCGANTPGWTIDVRPGFRTTTTSRARVDRSSPPRRVA